MGAKKPADAATAKAAIADDLKDGRTWLRSHISKGNKPIPINREKNIFSSASRLIFLRSSHGGITNKTAAARIVRKPDNPNSANAARAVAAKAESQAIFC